LVPSLRRHASEHDGASDDAFGVGVDRERKREEKDRRGPKLNQYSNHNPHQTTDASGYTRTNATYAVVTKNNRGVRMNGTGDGERRRMACAVVRSAADDAEDDGDDDDEGHQRQRDHQHQLHRRA